MKIKILDQIPKDGNIVEIDGSLMRTASCIQVDDVVLVLKSMTVVEEVNCTVTEKKAPKPKAKPKKTPSRAFTRKDVTAAREREGLSKTALANKLGVTSTTITNVEEGKPITEATRLKVEEFLGGTFKAKIRAYPGREA